MNEQNFIRIMMNPTDNFNTKVIQSKDIIQGLLAELAEDKYFNNSTDIKNILTLHQEGARKNLEDERDQEFSHYPDKNYLTKQFINLNTNNFEAIYPRSLNEILDYAPTSTKTTLNQINDNVAIITSGLVQGKDLPVLTDAVPQNAFSGDTDKTIYTFGDDDRTLVGDTSWDQKIAFITVENSDGSRGGFTGALISPFHILTVAHGIYDKNTGFVDSDTIQVSLGQDGTQRYYGTANAVSYTYFTGYTEDSNWQFRDGEWRPNSFNDDMAIITLDRNIGNFTGWFGYKYNNDDSYFQNLTVNTAGYPSDLAKSWSWDQDRVADVDLYFNSDPITEVSEEIFRYKLDIAGGQSGSPVWQYNSNTEERHIVGVHSFGSTSSNGASRITQGKFNVIQDTIQEQKQSRKPTDRPDLVDYDDWFDTNFAYFRNNTNGGFQDDSSNSTLDVAVGDSITFRSVIRNNGTARVDDGLYFVEPQVDVSFYASADETINSFDYKIGEVSISAIDPFDWSDAILNTAFPDIPEGEYYIGYEVGSIMSEFTGQVFDYYDSSGNKVFRSNNIGKIDGSKINVVHEKDLSGYSFNVVQEPLETGDSFDINFAIQNSENYTAGAFEVDFYLSTNDTISSSDRYLGSYSIASLLGNTNTGTLTTNLTLPDASDAFWNGDGNYYIGMIVDADYQVSETNESNNNSTGEFIDYDGVTIAIASDTQGTSSDDYLLGDIGDNTINAGGGNDSVVGGSGNDTIYGEDGNDTLTGSDPDEFDSGSGEYDVLSGGSDADTFVLGDSFEAYYQGLGYATITDFDWLEGDRIRAHGSSSDYSLGFGNWVGGSAQDTAIFYDNDAIAVVQDSTNVDFNRDFVFV